MERLIEIDDRASGLHAVIAIDSTALGPAGRSSAPPTSWPPRLAARGVLHVPDLVASAGAVIEGIGVTVMGLAPADRARLIDRLGFLAGEILERSAATGTPADAIAEELAAVRLAKFV